ncbi:hypothetical protein METH109765_18445 [Mesobacillus thioparans]
MKKMLSALMTGAMALGILVAGMPPIQPPV